MTRRIAKLKAILKKKKLGAFLITDPVNVYYISGFKTDVSSLLITGEENFIITDFRYKQDAEDIDCFTVRLVKAGFKNTLKKILEEREIKQLGFEAGNLSYSTANLLKAFLKKSGIGFEPLSGTVEYIRLYKDEAEIEEIKNAAAIAKKVVANLRKEVKPGITERRLAALLENLIRDNGGDGNAFETIIASGRNSSRPHAYTTDKVLTKDEHVLVDFGVRVNSYNCDLTRIFFLGRIQKILKDIYSICKEAQARAVKKVKPGAKIKDIDRSARGYIASKGFGKYFGHSLGHGVGLAIHELPRIFPKTNQALKPNMVFTVEPGIYLDETGGMRIEDMVLVTEKGCEILTDDIPK